MKSLLPIILVVLLLTGAITYSLAKRATPKREENRFGIAANQLTGTAEKDTTTPTPKKTSGFGVTPTVTGTPTPTATPTVTPTTLPSTSEADKNPKTDTTKGGTKKEVAKTTKVTKTTVCTPVYGSANTCTEHVVVDTGAADAIFFNVAGLSYLAGLAAFIKAKRA